MNVKEKSVDKSYLSINKYIYIYLKKNTYLPSYKWLVVLMGISRDRITGILCTIFRSEDAPNQEKWLNHVAPQPDAPKKSHSSLTLSKMAFNLSPLQFPSLPIIQT
jgi:hypothetical protein